MLKGLRREYLESKKKYIKKNDFSINQIIFDNQVFKI